MKRTVLCSLLALSILALPASAQRGRMAETRKAPHLVAILSELFERLLPSLAGSHAGMDPDGKPASENPPPAEDPDAHAGMDPDGKS